MNGETIEFKTKNPGESWEASPIIYSKKYAVNQAKRIDEDAYLMSGVLGKQIRWNFEGSPQGHYICDYLATIKSEVKVEVLQ